MASTCSLVAPRQRRIATGSIFELAKPANASLWKQLSATFSADELKATITRQVADITEPERRAFTMVELMVAAGMSPMNVIVAATGRAARYLGVTDTGTLTQGQRADFLVLDANPLDDIRNTRRIAAIYVGGAMVDRGALRSALQQAN